MGRQGRAAPARGGPERRAQGKPINEQAVKDIIASVDSDIPVQLGGGIRDLDTIERYLDDGVSFVIIGTAAVKNPGFLHEACDAFPGHIIVGLDAKDGKVATDGWSRLTKHDVIDLRSASRTTASRR
jgi:phosphoribosylformimino-5-aminoimidazole carboxamide ribotide isomerase